MQTDISPKIAEYIKSISDKSSSVQLDGYYHVDAVIDAFSKGEENGKESVVEILREKLVRNSTQMFIYASNVFFDLREQGFEMKNFYVNPFDFKFIIVTSVENTYNEEFIDKFYSFAFRAEDKFHNETNSSMRISFIGDNNINEDELVADGYFNGY